MEKAKNSNAATTAQVDIMLITFDGTDWKSTNLPLRCDGFGGIGIIRLEDNLRMVGTCDPSLRILGLLADQAPGSLLLPLQQGEVSITLLPGELLITVPVDKKLQIWTTARLK